MKLFTEKVSRRQLAERLIVMDPSGLSYAQRVIEHNFEPEASAFQ